MKPIVFPLQLGMQGSEVANLQEALFFIMYKLNLKPGNLGPDRWEQSATLSEERRNKIFRTETLRFLQGVLEALGIPFRDMVDEPTAEALNKVLKDLGALDNDTASSEFVVSGQVQYESGQPIKGRAVRAFHQNEVGSIRLGEDTTDAEGSYTIRYKALPSLAAIDLRLVVADSNGEPLSQSEVIHQARALEVINLTVPISKRPEAQRRLEGRIVFDHRLPAENIRLRLYRHDFGGVETILNETTTRRYGFYALSYEAGDKPASLEIRAVDAEGKEISLSHTLHDMGEEKREAFNLVAPATLQPLAAEYQRLASDLTPQLGDITKLAEARENAERQDLALLNRATGWDARLIALAANAAKLSVDPEPGLSQEALYGLFRAGLPMEKTQLSRVSAETVEKALNKAKDAGIVNLDNDQIAAAKTAFKDFSNTARFAARAPGTLSSFGDLLAKSAINETEKNLFKEIYLSHKGTDTDLWKIAREKGMSEAGIRSLRLQGKLAYLTLNNADLVETLQKEIGSPDDPARSVEDNLAQLVEKDFYKADQWGKRLNEMAGNDEALNRLIPPAYIGEKAADRQKAYAADLARKVRLSFPTRVVAQMIKNDELSLGDDHEAVKTPVKTFLDNATRAGFELGSLSLAMFIKQNEDKVFAGIDPEVKDKTIQNVRKLQRLYQITPSNESLQTVAGLGFASAHEVVAYPPQVFLDRFGGKFPSMEEAKLVHQKAQQVSAVVYNFFTTAKKLESDPGFYAMSGSPQQRADAITSFKNNLIKHYPKMESLFGSLDFCECEHCNSVLSPAAYLVDLFQFLEPEVWQSDMQDWKKKHNKAPYPFKDQFSWNKFQSDWKKDHPSEPVPDTEKKPYDILVERRPDLPHLPLTCENTHTVMPYIDIVNEILEYYVANKKLDVDAAHDTGVATTPELLAEPQNIIPDAYKKLKEAHYPLTLPFDLWLETARRFCEHFDTPFWQMLEIFRPSDELFAPALPAERVPYYRTDIFAEYLNISLDEYKIFTEADSLAKWQKLYGYEKEADALAALKSAKTLSRRLGVSYKQLVEIVQTWFINPKLDALVILRKLGLNTDDVFLHKAPPDEAALTPEKKAELKAKREAFEKKLDNLTKTFAPAGFNARTWLDTAWTNGDFKEILVLADPEAGCNFDKTILQYANGNPTDGLVFLKINLFVRLWKKLGWTMEETDRALRVFVPQKSLPLTGANLGDALKTALVYLAHLQALDQEVKVGKNSRLKLLMLWSNLATTGKDSLYAQLFLTPSMLRKNPVFDDPLGNYLAKAGIAKLAEATPFEVTLENVLPANKLDPVAFDKESAIKVSYDEVRGIQRLIYIGVLDDAKEKQLNDTLKSKVLADLLEAVKRKAADFFLVKGHLLALQGALNLTADEVEWVLTDAKPDPAKAELSLENVSLLYRYGLLAKAMKLTIRDLIALKELSGLDPFKELKKYPLSEYPRSDDQVMALDADYPLSQTLRFVEVLEKVKDSGFMIEDLDYLLRHRFDPVGKYRPNTEATLSLVKTLAADIRRIQTEHAVPKDSAVFTDEVLRQKLALIFPPDVVEIFMGMWTGKVEYEVVKNDVKKDVKSELKEDITKEAAIRKLSYNKVKEEQRLTFQGVLLDGEMKRLKAEYSASAVFAALLDEVQKEAKTFFEERFQKHTIDGTKTAGFFEAKDFDLLFAPIPPIPDEQDEEQRKKKLKENENQDREKREKMAQAFLPYLRQQLIRQMVVQTLATNLSADPAFTEALLTDIDLLNEPEQSGKPLLDAFVAAGDRGVSATFFESNDDTGVTKTLSTIDTSIKDAKPDKTKSVRFEGYLEVPIAGAYRFFAVSTKKDIEVEFRFAHLADPLILTKAGNDEDATELKTGVPYYFTLDARALDEGNIALLVQSENLPKGNLDRLVLYPQAAVERVQRAQVLLAKTVQLMQALGLNERELRHSLMHAADFNDLDLNQLPTRDASLDLEAVAKKYQESDPKLTKEQAMAQARKNYPQLTAEADGTLANATTLFNQFLRFVDYVRLKRDVADSANDLIGIFENARRIPQASDNADQVKIALFNDLCKRVAELTRRNLATVQDTAKSLGFFHSMQMKTVNLQETKPDAPPGKGLKGLLQRLREAAKRLFDSEKTATANTQPYVEAPDFTQEKSLKRLWEALQVVEKFGIPVEVIMHSATPAPDFFVARDLKNSIKARYEPEDWQRIAQPIFDKLRQRQRDALAAYIIHQHDFESMEQLFEYFLIDPGMEPVVQTSRLRLAISSVQLFIQRCLMNLEPWVSPSAINSKYWQWMKRYRIWEANRKIFLFPENWLEPEFRDDKTHLFQEFESALLQGDVSNDLAEDAFFQYLKSLEQIAALKMVAMYREKKNDPALNILHVIGRTQSLPHKYFYRRYANKMWTPWEPVTAEIEGDHIVAVVWRQRLHLFWVTFLEKAKQDGNTGKTFQQMAGEPIPAVPKEVEVQLNWSEYFQGKWTTRESSGFGNPIRACVPNSFNSRDVFIYVSGEDEENSGIKIHLVSNEFLGKIKTAFQVVSKNSPPEIKDRELPQSPPFLKIAKETTQYVGQDALQVTVARVKTENGKLLETTEAPSDIIHCFAKYYLLLCAYPSTIIDDIRYWADYFDSPSVSMRLDVNLNEKLGKLIRFARSIPIRFNNASTSVINAGLVEWGNIKNDIQSPSAGGGAPPADEIAYFQVLVDLIDNLLNRITISKNVPAIPDEFQSEIRRLANPFFYQDNQHTYFVEPSLTESTMEHWEKWAVSMPADQDWENGTKLETIHIEANVPVDKLTSRIDLVDSVARFQLQPKQDWLTSSIKTFLKFDLDLVGPDGR